MPLKNHRSVILIYCVLPMMISAQSSNKSGDSKAQQMDNPSTTSLGRNVRIQDTINKIRQLAISCDENASFYCIESRDYPAAKIESLIEKNLTHFTNMLSNDLLVNNSKQRSHLPSEEQICDSYERIIYPRMMRNRQNNWLFVVNQKNFHQGVRIEHCLEENSKCMKISNSLPFTYSSVCRQQYSYRFLLALNKAGELVKDVFALPSCCKCYIKSK